MNKRNNLSERSADVLDLDFTALKIPRDHRRFKEVKSE